VFRSVAARNSEKYSAFSCLIRSTFEDAVDCFSEGSVDLLHIDGHHFYDNIERDFTLWRPKLTEDAVVLFHDTNVRENTRGSPTTSRKQRRHCGFRAEQYAAAGSLTKVRSSVNSRRISLPSLIGVSSAPPLDCGSKGGAEAASAPRV